MNESSKIAELQDSGLEQTVVAPEKWTPLDRLAMRRCLIEARAAAERGETPIGATLVHQGTLLCSAGNSREKEQDPLGHAELKVLAEGAKILGSWRLEECTLYVSLEPCMMCAGAIVQARVPELIFGASDPKGGFVHSQAQLLDIPSLNHHVHWRHGLYADESSELLKTFFRKLRAARKGMRR